MNELESDVDVTLRTLCASDFVAIALEYCRVGIRETDVNAYLRGTNWPYCTLQLHIKIDYIFTS